MREEPCCLDVIESMCINRREQAVVHTMLSWILVISRTVRFSSCSHLKNLVPVCTRCVQKRIVATTLETNTSQIYQQHYSSVRNEPHIRRKVLTAADLQNRDVAIYGTDSGRIVTPMPRRSIWRMMTGNALCPPLLTLSTRAFSDLGLLSVIRKFPIAFINQEDTLSS